MGSPAPAPRPAQSHGRSPVPNGQFVMLDGETHYRIAAYPRLAPFLASIPSDTDLWMFITSGGGLTAGRVNADGALFPYRTVDQLHEAHHHTGPVTMIRLEQPGTEAVLWEPFNPDQAEDPATERNLYKNTVGNRIVFEEIRHELGLAFRYSWSACDEFGWVRTATLENLGDEPQRVTILDGLRNVLPFGAPLRLYQQTSNLVDAYKKTEVDPASGLGIFALTAGITDRAEAIEVLRANTVWCCGLEGFRVHLSQDALVAFRQEKVVPAEEELRGARGNYLVSCRLDLAGGETSRWHLVADSGRDQVQVASLRRQILADEGLAARLATALRQAGDNLKRFVASADGLQMTGQPESWAHHFANVLYNNMRGGVFAANYDVPRDDLVDFLRVRNPAAATRQRARLAALPASLRIQDLRQLAAQTGDADFERLCREYLPLHFGRRHGDPSRPWNQFAIRVRNDRGEPVLNYEGNWRDIFQNWEALGTAFPGFLPNFVAKFVNASTVDGFNPYRLNREGVDWETVTADDAWSNIGYWGDHQIIYLLKLLEAWVQHDPGGILRLLDQDIFSYAAVPYRIKPYADILKDPSDTITFDAAANDRIERHLLTMGTDGKLMLDAAGKVLHVNLLEKLLVPALAKLSNLVPDGGIWMNTQRPEWNDANNALAGGGISVVTLCHLRRYLKFLERTLAGQRELSLPVSTEVVDWFSMISIALESEAELLQAPHLAPQDRRRVLDRLGRAYSAYRESVYARGFTGRSDLAVARVLELCGTALAFIDWGLAANRREDGLFHTYNMLDVDSASDTAAVLRLPQMLEGQVAILTSGFLSAGESLSVLDRLYLSDLYRREERSFILYPERRLPGFLAKNAVTEAEARAIPLLRDLLAADNDTLLRLDVDGVGRFHPDFENAARLEAALDELAADRAWAKAVGRDRDAILALFEKTYGHQSYTGRSGTMYGYEGLGCIYWHMVAKLLLAVQETQLRAREAQEPASVQANLARMYLRIRSGIGYEKSVAEYGAFPTDPYSHTPAGGGAKQPGMTGQVKEEILTRRGELGVAVEQGTIRFSPLMLRRDEFTSRPGQFSHYDLTGEPRTLALPAGCLAFTLCQVPVVYAIGPELQLQVTLADGTSETQKGDRLEARLAAEIFGRSGRVRGIQVTIPEAFAARPSLLQPTDQV